MKTFNTKLIVALFTTLVLTGCMPDSLTKFKKDPPKKEAATASETIPPIIDSSGKVVDPTTLVYPTKFYYGIEGVPTEEVFQLYSTVSATDLIPNTDGTIANPATKNLLFIRCELDTSGAVITRTLPPGLSLSPSTCSISGVPTTIYSDTTAGNIGGKITYTVRMIYKGANYTTTGVESSLSAVVKLAIYNIPSALNMTQNEKLQVKLSAKSGALVSNIQTNTDSLVDYNRYGVLTSNKGVAGIVKYVDATSNMIGIYRVQPLVVGSTIPFSVNGFVSTSGNVKRGKILSINTTTKTLYVEALTSNTTFAAGDALDNATSFLAAESTVVSVDSSYKFSAAAKVDNDLQYFTEKFNMDTITQTYERGITIQPISPILNSTILPANGVSYSISPALPDGLSFDETTGIISGVFNNTLDATSYTVTAYNDLGESNYIVSLAAINSPKDLSYTSNQLISVNSNALFIEGESLFQPILPPLTTSVQGKILRKVSTNKLSIETINGAFLSEASLDSGNAYYSEKNYVTLSSNPNYYNLALSVSSVASFTVGGYVGSSTGAKGRVIYIDSINSVLYIQFLTPSIVSSVPSGAIIYVFAEGASLDNVYPYVTPRATITQVEATNMALKLSATVGFDPGNDFTSNTNMSGYVYDWDTINDVIKVNEINRTGAVGSPYFKIAQLLDPSEYYASAVDAGITGVSHDNIIILDRGVNRILKSNLSQGTSIIYSISPTLPSGLSLDTTTGAISGTPTAMSTRKSYVVTATNLLDKSYYAFDLEVRDHFSFSESSGAKSFLTHKIGDNRISRACRINSTDILNGNSAALDIGCNLEAEELELFYAKLKLTASVGGGTCEYIGFKPYSFWQYAPEKTARTIDYMSSCSAGTAPGTATTTAPTSANSCYGNYTDEGGPNCDTGTVTVNTYTASTGTTCDTLITSSLACGGTKTSCLAGPVTTVMSLADLQSGYRAKVVASSSGATSTWTLKSSVEFFDLTNIRYANDVVNNSCSSTRTSANTWNNTSVASLSTQNPFGGESPYYEFTCLDAAQDVKARIRLSIREWNRTFRINDSLNSIIPAKMNDNTAPPFGPSYNNSLDWDDDYTALGSATILSCGATPGACSLPIHKSSAACTGAGGTWTTNGLCSNPTYTTPTQCERSGFVWSTNGYRFPKDNI